MCALLAAVNAHSPDCIQLLLERGANATWAPVVAAACAAGNEECVRLLLSAGAPADRLERGFTPLHFCACVGKEPSMNDELISFATEHPVAPEAFSACARAVIELGPLSPAQLDARDERSAAMPALAYAARWGASEVVHVLLDKGASKEVRGPEGWTAAQFARNAGHESLANTLEI